MSLLYKRRINVGFKKFVDTNCVTKDFPKKGVNFIDIFPIIKRRGLKELNEVMTFPEAIILIPEARGFLFAGELDWNKIVPLRKKGKLPGEVMEIKYEKEYGSDSLFFQIECIRDILWKTEWDKSIPVPVCFFDDVLATGGTAEAVTKFFNELNIEGYTFNVVSNKFYIEILDLKGKERLRNLKQRNGESLKVESVYEY